MTSSRTRRVAIDAARSMAPELSGRAVEAEGLRTLPADVVAELRAAGLFRLLLPVSLGGMEVDPVTMVEVVEELSRADGSAGWTVLIGNSAVFFAWLDPSVAHDLVGEGPDVVSTAMFAPLGRAVPDGDDAFVVDGRWPFNSGAPHADWFQVGVFVMDGDAPRMLPDRGPDWRFAFLRRDEVVVEDTWDAAGLRATGSHHVRVESVRLPAERLAAPLFEAARHDGPLGSLSLFTVVGITFAGFPLGVARRALDEFAAAAGGIVRGGDGEPVAVDGCAQSELSRVEAGLQAARAFVFATVGELWTAVSSEQPPSVEQRARLQLAVHHAMSAALDAVDVAMRFSGASAVLSSHPLQRCLRDLHVANQHIYFSSDARKRYGRLKLGLPERLHLI